MSNEFMFLDGTPIVAIKRGDLKLSPYAIGRRDTKEMMCLGTFGKDFADMHNEGEIAYLYIKSDGSVAEIYFDFIDKEPGDCVKLDERSAIVAIKFGSYWLLPNGFREWAKKVF